MQIAIIGCGYVGLVTGACFARMGNRVVCIDVDQQKIEQLKNGQVPIYETGLESLVNESLADNSLVFSTSFSEGLEGADVVFICVGTPMNSDGTPCLDHIFAAARQIASHIRDGAIVATKSTVPVGTTEQIRDVLMEELDKTGRQVHFEMVSNPEFLKEGVAIDDFMRPDRIIIGCENESVINRLRELYSPFIHKQDRIISMDIRSAEMTKYAANGFLATKISFMNEIAVLCEKVGADVNRVRAGIGSDPRIGYSFIYPGCGFGGSCLPKDVYALIHMGADENVPTDMMCAVRDVNERQKKSLAQKVRSVFGDDLFGYRFALWGLAFKPDTNDIREAPSLTIIEDLLAAGAEVMGYDPKANKEVDCFLGSKGLSITFGASKYEVLKGADALLLITEWREFRSPDFEEMGRLLKNKIIFDGRNQYNSQVLLEFGFRYVQVGVPELKLAPVEQPLFSLEKG